MRTITKKAVVKFLNAEPFNSGNTSVKIFPNVSVLVLFGNEIAYKYNNPEKTLAITTCGYKTNTTKERLNALPNVHIQVKKGVWYLNSLEWDGKLTDEFLIND
jgi:hypothetical protein